MDINELISLLRKPEHLYDGANRLCESMIYGQNIVLELAPEQHAIYNAILKTIPKDTLKTIASGLRREPDCAKSLIDKIEWMSQDHPRKSIEKNEPIGRLLRYYIDKKSKKVEYARKHLRSRFEQQSYQEQNKILKAFLNGTKDDYEWAAKYLRRNWRKEMTSAVSTAWEKTGSLKLAYVILRHLPNEYILKEQTRLSDIAGYQYVCARVGNEPSFEFEESRLDTPDLFYVMAKLGRIVDARQMERWFYDYLYSYPYDYKQLELKPASLLSIKGVDIMIWAMGVLGMQDALVRLLKFNDKLMNTVDDVYRKGEHESWPILVATLKLEINPFEDLDILEKEQRNYNIQTKKGESGYDGFDDMLLFF